MAVFRRLACLLSNHLKLETSPTGKRSVQLIFCVIKKFLSKHDHTTVSGLAQYWYLREYVPFPRACHICLRSILTRTRNELNQILLQTHTKLTLIVLSADPLTKRLLWRWRQRTVPEWPANVRAAHAVLVRRFQTYDNSHKVHIYSGKHNKSICSIQKSTRGRLIKQSCYF